jgi:ketosteroid isomerase-like protein
VIARWEIEPLHRSRRGFEERLLLAAPWLVRALVARAARARAGSPIRRVVLGRLVRSGIEAVNRGDYELLPYGLSPAVEVYLLPDAPEARPGDTESVYHGRDGYLKAVEIWKTDFDNLRWEVRELIDPGGSLIAGRAERTGRGARSGAEVRDTDFFVWQFDGGLLRRQWILRSEAAMLATLEAARSPHSHATATQAPT